MIRIEDRLAAYVDRLDADSMPITPDEVFAGRPGSGSARGRAVLAAALVAIVLVAGAIISQLDDHTQVATGPATDMPPAEALAPASDDVSLWLSAGVAPPGDTDIVAVLLNHSAVEALFGVSASIERWDGQSWVDHRSLLMCQERWQCTGESVNAGEGLDTPALGLIAEPGSLGPPGWFSITGLDEGWYRISQRATLLADDPSQNEDVVASGVVRVAADAATPAPLWPTDLPSMSITPSIVSTAGGTISLRPEVPPIDGVQTMADYVAAVEGLSESASIERWDGRAWEPIDEVPLAASSDVDAHARSTDLPPLAAGAYRLVRTGPNEPHTRNFWVVDDAVLDGEAPIAPDSSDQGAGTDDGSTSHTIRLPDAGIAVTVDLPARLQPPPNPREPGNSLPYVEQWLDPENRHLVGLSIQEDPGDDAPLFQMLRIQQFDSPLGVWTVHELGGDGMATAMVMLRHDGLVYQVTGGVPHAPAVAGEIARSLQVEPLEAR